MWVWTPDYRKVELPNTGYLAASSNRSDSDCVRRAHLDAVLAARREQESLRAGGYELHQRPIVKVALMDGIPRFWAWAILAYAIIGGVVACL